MTGRAMRSVVDHTFRLCSSPSQSHQEIMDKGSGFICTPPLLGLLVEGLCFTLPVGDELTLLDTIAGCYIRRTAIHCSHGPYSSLLLARNSSAIHHQRLMEEAGTTVTWRRRVVMDSPHSDTRVFAADLKKHQLYVQMVFSEVSRGALSTASSRYIARTSWKNVGTIIGPCTIRACLSAESVG
ncbi:hypothetical protein B0O80DRAFT_421984 [Mortierella sp. GBAus27b]|nr:hypothetical protein B0O80DRAFT_421984 [Mortierella sp. GBAus27b]